MPKYLVADAWNIQNVFLAPITTSQTIPRLRLRLLPMTQFQDGKLMTLPEIVRSSPKAGVLFRALTTMLHVLT